MLGTRCSLSVFRWDLLYLLARLLADKRPEVKALGETVQAHLDALRVRRDTHEGAEDAVVIAGALLNKEDKERDKVLLEMGGVARVRDKDMYKALFATYSPSKTARLPIQEESAEVRRILGEFAALPVDHPLRVTYEKPLAMSEELVVAASKQSDEAATQLALQRAQTERFKLSVDKGRLSVHGSLVVLTKDKDEAESFFRPTATAPGDTGDESGTSAVVAPAPPPAPPVPAQPQPKAAAGSR
jgi:hypothetical protein